MVGRDDDELKNKSFFYLHTIEKKKTETKWNEMKTNDFVYYETNFDWNATVCFGGEDDESLAEPGK